MGVSDVRFRVRRGGPVPPRREPLRNSFRTLRPAGQRWERPPLAATRMNSRNNGRVPAAVAVEQLDQGDALAIGQGQSGDGDGIVVFSQDEAAGPGRGGRPPSGHLEGLSCRVFCLEPASSHRRKNDGIGIAAERLVPARKCVSETVSESNLPRLRPPPFLTDEGAHTVPTLRGRPGPDSGGHDWGDSPGRRHSTGAERGTLGSQATHRAVDGTRPPECPNIRHAGSHEAS